MNWFVVQPVEAQTFDGGACTMINNCVRRKMETEFLNIQSVAQL